MRRKNNNDDDDGGAATANTNHKNDDLFLVIVLLEISFSRLSLSVRSLACARARAPSFIWSNRIVYNRYQY